MTPPPPRFGRFKKKRRSEIVESEPADPDLGFGAEPDSGRCGYPHRCHDCGQPFNCGKPSTGPDRCIPARETTCAACWSKRHSAW